ncbi:hypothetical protein N9D61_03180 [Planktomarina sp.]|jgi:hypothetical protein|nr:hypothetical protein [Planktomarina sp.]
MANLQATNVNGTLVALRQENTTTASKSLALADRDKVIACTNSSAITITIPNDSGTNFPVGSVVYIARVGSGAVSLAAAGGVTVNKTGAFGDGEEVYCRKRAANNWVVVDSITTLTATGGTKSSGGSQSFHTYTSTGASTFVVS